jgi:hypothetical protein
MVRVIAWMTLLVSSVAANDVATQGAGDPREGLIVAREFCSECHAAQQGQIGSPNSRAPTFVALANTPGMTATALAAAPPRRVLASMSHNAQCRERVRRFRVTPPSTHSRKRECP